MTKSKLYRNLKPGDQFKVETGYGISRYMWHIVTVSSVKETRRAFFTGKRQWAVYGDYPWWFSGPIHAYSYDRVTLVEKG